MNFVHLICVSSHIKLRFFPLLGDCINKKPLSGVVKNSDFLQSFVKTAHVAWPCSLVPFLCVAGSICAFFLHLVRLNKHHLVIQSFPFDMIFSVGPTMHSTTVSNLYVNCPTKLFRQDDVAKGWYQGSKHNVVTHWLHPAQLWNITWSSDSALHISANSIMQLK